MKKSFGLIGIILLAALMCIPLVSAQDTIIVSYGTENFGGSGLNLKYVHPTSGLYYSAIGTNFTIASPETVGGVDFYLRMVEGGTGHTNYTAHIWELDTDGLPLYDNLPNATSTTIVSTAEYSPTSYTLTRFVFNDTLPAGSYAVTITGYAVSGISRDYYEVGVDSTSPAYSGANLVDYYSSAWHGDALYDLIFYVYAEDAVSPTPTPTPAAADNSIENLTNIILPWLVPLLICLIPALLGYKFVGELGFFIGLNVGCILAYVTLAGTAYAFPLWGIILVGVMDVAVVLMRR